MNMDIVDEKTNVRVGRVTRKGQYRPRIGWHTIQKVDFLYGTDMYRLKVTHDIHYTTSPHTNPSSVGHT